MPGFIKPGKVAVVLQGRHAGKKAVVIKNFDEGNKAHPYPHAVVAGIERYPQKVTKSMGKTKIARRSTVKPFIKVINYNHIMPTRYTLELEGTKSLLTAETFKEPSQRKTAKKTIRKIFEDKYKAGKNKWFFTKLRF
ncbi:putative 60S large subunit ribosomal protein L27 [Blastocladiella britannica]|nr:putative 60S large subunit ribosomal protein L27 [Blastocladiella britannica]